MDVSWGRGYQKTRYGIIISSGMRNFLVRGRCAYYFGRASYATSQRPLFCHGARAGTAVKRSCRAGVKYVDIDRRVLQNRLVADSAFIRNMELESINLI